MVDTSAPLMEELERAQAEVERLKRAIANGPCLQYGHTWASIGGCNAGCELGRNCVCSVPVHECTKCGDCDYGVNKWAEDERRDCRIERGVEP